MNEEDFEKRREFVAKLMDQGFSEVRALAEWNTQQENKDTNPARKLVDDAFRPAGGLINASGYSYIPANFNNKESIFHQEEKRWM